MLKDALKAGPVWALGAMSGTSLDGVDAALVLTDGEVISAFGPAGYRAYDDGAREVIRAALGRWPGEDGVGQAARAVEALHAELLGTFEGAALVGFHGQTLAHDPHGDSGGGPRTHQAGDGAALSEALGLPVVWDFRSADVMLGGEGAPLAPFFHFACAQFVEAKAPVAFLNLGGVGNVTWVDPSKGAPEEEGALLAFDTGPANAPINDLMRARGLGEMDAGGLLAMSGTVDESVVAAFLEHPYFYRMPPKSLDRDQFAGLLEAVSNLNERDAAATLAGCCVGAVARGMEHCPSPPAALYVTGGGRHNAALMAGLSAALPCEVLPVEEVGLDGDMLEAQAFAYLAVRIARGLPTSGPSTTGIAGYVGGGEVSYPMNSEGSA